MWCLFCPVVDSSLQTAAETVQLQRWRAAIRTLLTGKEKKMEKWNQTAEQSRRPLSLQRGYFKGMTESDALRGLKDQRSGHSPNTNAVSHFPLLLRACYYTLSLGGVPVQTCTLLKCRQNFLAVLRIRASTCKQVQFVTKKLMHSLSASWSLQNCTVP